MRVTAEDTRDDIQAAIDALADGGGGRLHIAAGTYDIDEALVWRANVDLRGEGYATHLRATDATNVVESHYDEELAEGELHDATIENMRLDGNRAAVPDGRDPGDDYPDTHSTSGLWIPFAERVTVRNLAVESCHGHGIHPDAAIDCTVENNVVRDCLTGFHIATRKGYEYGPVRTVARGNHAIDCRLNGLDFGSGGRECVMAHNTVTGCGHGGHGEGQWAGIRMRGTDHAAVGNVVVDSARGIMLARQRSTAGGEVHWEPGARLLALGNRVRNAAVGIEVRDAEDCAVAANAVAGADTAIEVGDGPGVAVSGNHAVGGGDGVVCAD
ncbi:MAG: right-handed parallel beta-helix repeat-containing protein [Halobacteriaceae archaeon]